MLPAILLVRCRGEAEAVHEDVDEALDAGAASPDVPHVAHADERAHDRSRRRDVGPDLARLGRGPRDKPSTASARRPVVVRRPVGFSLGCNGQAPQPCRAWSPPSTLACNQAQRRQGSGSVIEPVGQLGELFDLAAIDRLEQRLARREMAVERCRCRPRPGAPPPRGWPRAAGAEDGLRRLEHALAIAHRVGAGPARLPGGLCSMLHVSVLLSSCRP